MSASGKPGTAGLLEQLNRFSTQREAVPEHFPSLTQAENTAAR
jgi:hypothetical protein